MAVFFALSGSVRVKAAYRTLMKLTPGLLLYTNDFKFTFVCLSFYIHLILLFTLKLYLTYLRYYVLSSLLFHIPTLLRFLTFELSKRQQSGLMSIRSALAWILAAKKVKWRQRKRDNKAFSKNKRNFRKRTSSIFGNPATQYLATPQSLN